MWAAVTHMCPCSGLAHLWATASQGVSLPWDGLLACWQAAVLQEGSYPAVGHLWAYFFLL